VGKLVNEERKNMGAKLQLWKQGAEASAKTVEEAAEGGTSSVPSQAERASNTRCSNQQPPSFPSLA